MEINTFSCDICKLQKQETNHWYLGYHFPGRIGRMVAIAPWGYRPAAYQQLLADSEPIAHLCGLGHALQWIGMQLAGSDRLPPTLPDPSAAGA